MRRLSMETVQDINCKHCKRVKESDLYSLQESRYGKELCIHRHDNLANKIAKDIKTNNPESEIQLKESGLPDNNVLNPTL